MRKFETKLERVFNANDTSEVIESMMKELIEEIKHKKVGNVKVVIRISGRIGR